MTRATNETNRRITKANTHDQSTYPHLAVNHDP